MQPIVLQVAHINARAWHIGALGLPILGHGLSIEPNGAGLFTDEEDGNFYLDKWRPFEPAQNPCASKGPWYYVNSEGIFIDFETDAEAARAVLPPEIELYEPATAFIAFVINHWTTISGPYAETYMGIKCKWQGEECFFLPAVYTTGGASRVVAREVYGCGKSLADRIEVTQHADGNMQGILEIKSGDRAACVVMRPAKNEPVESLGSHQFIPLIFLKTFPDPEGSNRPALAQLVAQPYPVNPHSDVKGRPTIFSGPGHLQFNWPTDLELPIRGKPTYAYARFDSVLEYGKILKTYAAADFEAAGVLAGNSRIWL